MRTELRAGARVVIAVALVSTLLGASAANGAVVIGQTAPGATNLCGTGNSAQSSEAGPPSYVIPTAGVITAWQHKAHASGGDGRLLVWKGPPVSPLTLAGRSAVETFAGEQLQSFATRVPVSAGDVLGLRVHSMNAGCTFFTGAGDTAIARGGAPDIAPGESMMTTSTLPNQRVNVSATLEPDADNDGYGDESQDACPTIAAYQSPCPVVEQRAFELHTTARVRKRTVLLLIDASDAASVEVGGQVSWRTHSKRGGSAQPRPRRRLVVRLGGGTQEVTPGTTARFRIPLPKRVQRRLKALRPRRSLRASLTVVATDPAGQLATNRLRVKLRGRKSARG
jgi:hypothetical protein